MPRSTRKKSKTGIYHVMLRVNTVPCSHKDIQKKKKGGKQYHKTRKELVEQYTILNDVFNEKMSEYEKLYGF